MVSYEFYLLDNKENYSFTKAQNFKGCSKKFNSTVKNINIMLKTNHPITLAIPEDNLSKEDIEEFRAFFCKKAKEDNMNYIYFEGPVTVSKIDVYSDTMFG